MKKRTLILLVGAIGIAAAAGFITRSSWMGGSSQRPGAAAAADGFGRTGQGGAQIRARRCRCDRNGDADLQRGAEVAAGDHHRRGAFRGRRQGQRRRSAVHARQPPDRRPDRAGRGRARQGPGAARGRAARPPPLQRSRRQGRDHAGQCRQRQDAVRHPGRHHQGQSGGARQSEGPEKLHHDPRAVLGADRRRQCEGRQFRAPGRYRAACRHQPDGAGLCDLRGSAARAGRSARVDGEGRLRRHRDHPGPSALRDRQGRDGRKHRGCDHRHGHRARHHEQRERDACGRGPWSRPS